MGLGLYNGAMRKCLFFWIWVALCTPVIWAEPEGPTEAASPEAVYTARDTLTIAADENPAANEILAGLRYTPGAFELTRQPLADDMQCDFLYSFPSPKPSGDDRFDRVQLQWFAAHDEAGQIIDAPAVLIVHTVHPKMVVAKGMATYLRFKKVHAFVVVMPGFGERRVVDQPSSLTALLNAQQGVTDVRRARDAIAVLPHVQTDNISLLGPSLGGFIATTCASMDSAFDMTFIMMAGADLYDVLENGEHDAALLRNRLHNAGYRDEKLRALLSVVEPFDLAHRLDPQTTWLVSARNDRVVPLRNGQMLAERIGLAEEHHLLAEANHYTILPQFPRYLNIMIDQINGVSIETPPAEPPTDETGGLTTSTSASIPHESAHP